MTGQPIAEVFGYPTDNFSDEAKRYRRHALCRFGNKVPNCTKDKADHPLGVCSILDGDNVVITCPVRFRESWLIAEDAASFFFPAGTRWTTLTEVRLKDKSGRTAGNIDVVLCAYNDRGRVIDFGALEIQAVYISGNIRNPFESYMEDPEAWLKIDWNAKQNHPKPDYLSSSRKRLAPQLIFKGGIFRTWQKKTVVAVNKGFYETLPTLQMVEPSKADIAWFVYDLIFDHNQQVYRLTRCKTSYTLFSESLEKITRSDPGDMGEFLDVLQNKVDAKLDFHDQQTIGTIDAPF
ncbi:MAG: hypothetical protein HQM04_08275 [Magnetococcales bacterium]|nr:hypothetical protein [Magnetococcales bacterium]MBF0115027.1 hypothetical protein [Magnetococcales bacterium]